MDSTIPYISLSQFTSEYCLATFNDERKHYINYLVHAKWIWKDLFLKSMYTVKSKYVQVDFTTVPFSIPIPKDNVRIINISTEGFNGRLEWKDTMLPEFLARLQKKYGRFVREQVIEQAGKDDSKI